MGKHKQHGFTIVELLIVIVIIAILAAITVVAYNGIQQRAQNTAKISNVDSLTKLISLYRADRGSYPVTTNSSYCLTTDNLCTGYDGTKVTSNNSSLMAALRTYSNPIASSGDDTTAKYYGIEYTYSTTRTLSGTLNPVIIVFWLNGTNQTCASAVGGMVSVKDGTGVDMVPGAQEKADTGTGMTRCYLMFSS